uniref:Uncharacterized protein n=1 Tax=Sus scrofa TaxID=9823 RepID=A0A4X1TA76_PIG
MQIPPNLPESFAHSGPVVPHLPTFAVVSVSVTDVASSRAVLGICGPRSSCRLW